MKLYRHLFNQLHCLQSTFVFLRRHILLIMLLGLVAALGRVLQLGAFGSIERWQHIALEVVIECARILLFLFVLGMANVKIGLLRLKHFVAQKAFRRKQWTAILQNARYSWFALLLNVIGFFAVAWMFNYLIDLLAYETCLYLNLKKEGILSASSSEWTILLFFKNLSVIPFTLVFEGLVVLWLTNKLTKPYMRTA